MPSGKPANICELQALSRTKLNSLTKADIMDVVLNSTDTEQSHDYLATITESLKHIQEDIKEIKACQIQQTAEFKKVTAELNELKKAQNIIRGELSELTNVQENTNMELSDLRKTQNDIQAKNENLNDHVDEKLKNFEERMKRKRNAIIFNIPESLKESEDEQKQDDFNKIKETLIKMTETNPKELSNWFRLGKRIKEKKRPIKIVMSTEDARDHVIGNAIKHNKADKVCAPKDKIYFNPDFTVTEHADRKKLRDELKQTREKYPTEKWTIKYDKIMNVNLNKKQSQNQ